MPKRMELGLNLDELKLIRESLDALSQKRNLSFVETKLVIQLENVLDDYISDIEFDDALTDARFTELTGENHD